MSTTIGYERRHNKYARIEDLEEFKQAMLDDAPPVPTHYPRLKKVNAAGPEVQHGLPRMPAVVPEAFEDLIDGDVQLLDVRDMLAFGGGHIPGAINIGLQPELSVWAGWLLDPEKPIALVAGSDDDIDRAVTLLWRVGFTRFAGYLAGGIGAWRESGRELAAIPQMSVHELKSAGGVTPLDVRKDAEWEGGHIPGAEHRFLGELRDRLDGLDRSRAFATYCASGFRAAIAASLLKRAGFEDVRNVPGSWKAWRAAGYPVEGGEDDRQAA